MATKDLITLDVARVNIAVITDNTQDALLQVLITGISDAIAKYCRRDFYSRFYDELYNGNGDRRLLLRQYPIQSVHSCRYRPVTVLKVTNSATANVQARVAVTNVGLTLVRVNAGVEYIDTSVTFASYPMLSQMAAAINALGEGWSAQAGGDNTNYGSWPSADLYWPLSYGDGLSSQGALQCVAGSFAELKMHTYELAGYQWDARGWLLRAIPYTDPELLHPEDLVWPTGINNFRIQYTAGYTTIPEAVQQACAHWVTVLWFLSQRDPQLVTQSAAGGTTSSWMPPVPMTPEPPALVRVLLAPYRRHTIATDQG
jgi:hypothetical protein